jgi:hypothetical protein
MPQAKNDSLDDSGGVDFTENGSNPTADPTFKQPVTRDALVKRINRALSADTGGPGFCDVMHKNRVRDDANLGDYYVVRQNGITAAHVDPVKWAREMNLIDQSETVED